MERKEAYNLYPVGFNIEKISWVLDTDESSWVLDTKKRGGQLNVRNAIVKNKEKFSWDLEMIE